MLQCVNWKIAPIISEQCGASIFRVRKVRLHSINKFINSPCSRSCFEYIDSGYFLLTQSLCLHKIINIMKYRGADKFLAQPVRRQVTVTEDFDVHISFLLS
jgi:hypothetical protein